MPVRLVTVIPPGSPWASAAAAVGVFLFPFPGDGPVSYWVKSACGRLRKGRNMTEPTRRGGCGVGCATVLLRTGTAPGLLHALALCKALVCASENEPLAQP